MSADNGIYILETDGPEYHVSYQMAIDNLEWNEELGQESSDPEVHIKNARRMWGNCHPYTDERDALVTARELDRQYGPTEYGITFIKIPRLFNPTLQKGIAVNTKQPGIQQCNYEGNILSMDIQGHFTEVARIAHDLAQKILGVGAWRFTDVTMHMPPKGGFDSDSVYHVQAMKK